MRLCDFCGTILSETKEDVIKVMTVGPLKVELCRPCAKIESGRLLEKTQQMEDRLYGNNEN